MFKSIDVQMQTWGVKFYQKMLMLSLELTSSSYSLDLMNSNTRAVLSCCVTGSHALWWQQNRFNHICGWTIVTYTSLELSACITRKLCWVISAQDLILWEVFFSPRHYYRLQSWCRTHHLPEAFAHKACLCLNAQFDPRVWARDD